jgi:hypothetical protein
VLVLAKAMIQLGKEDCQAESSDESAGDYKTYVTRSRIRSLNRAIVPTAAALQASQERGTAAVWAVDEIVRLSPVERESASRIYVHKLSTTMNRQTWSLQSGAMMKYFRVSRFFSFIKVRTQPP